MTAPTEKVLCVLVLEPELVAGAATAVVDVDSVRHILEERMQAFNHLDHLGLGLGDGDGRTVFASFYVTVPGYPAKDRRFVDCDLQTGHRIRANRKNDPVTTPDGLRDAKSAVKPLMAALP
jgi:hypothetical protein